MLRRQAITLLALAGCVVALYLWLYKLGIVGVLQCGTGGCETVQASRYAEFLGIPVALFGVIGYAVLFGLSLADVQAAARGGPARDTVLAVLSSLGFAFTLYLTAVELFVIHAICRWCIGSAVIMTAIWGLSLAGLRRAS
jgi:uncharacterized membrane protein